MGSGSSGGSTSQEFKPPENTQQGWNQYMQTATGLSGQPYQASGIPTNAPWNDYQQAGANMIYDQAMNGDPSTQAGRSALTGIASGNQSNPWQAFMANTAAGNAQNPFMSGAQGMAAGEKNPHMIDPQAFIDATTKDMTKAAQNGVMAQTDSAANRAGAYGGSAYQEMQTGNAKALEDSVGTMSQNAKLAANAQNAQNWQSGQQNRLQAMGLGGGMFDQGQGRQLQAAMGGGQMFNNDITNMLSAAGIAPQYGAMDMAQFNNLMGVGNQMQGYQQGLLNSGNQAFQQQMMYPWTMNEMYGGALTRASGQGGSSTSTMMQPGYSPWANAAGLGLAAYGAFGGGH